MRILRIESSRNWGGQEERLLHETAWLNRNGHSVAIVCDPEAALLPRAKELQIPCFPLRMRLVFNPLASLALQRTVAKWNADVVHTNSPKDSWLAFPLHILGIPVIRSRNISLPDRMSWARGFIYHHGCRRIITAAEFIARTLREQVGVPADRIDVIGEGVDTKIFHPRNDGSAFRREMGIPTDAPLFGVVAMLRGEKGQRYFLRAALDILKTHPDYRFVMVGRGTGKGNIEQKLQEEIRAAFPTGTPPVILAGFRRDIPEVMAALTALVVPSLHDAQTLVIPQAFATGRTVIASRVGGIPEIVKNEQNGLLIESKDEKGLAAAMVRIAENPEFRKKLEAAGLDLAEKELSFDHRMQQLLDAYRKALAA